MAFNREENVTIVGIEDFEVRLFSAGPSNTEGVEAVELTYQNLMSNGEIEASEKIVNLLVRLPDDAEGLIHLANLASFRDYIRIRLNAEAIPTP